MSSAIPKLFIVGLAVLVTGLAALVINGGGAI